VSFRSFHQQILVLVREQYLPRRMGTPVEHAARNASTNVKIEASLVLAWAEKLEVRMAQLDFFRLESPKNNGLAIKIASKFQSHAVKLTGSLWRRCRHLLYSFTRPYNSTPLSTKRAIDRDSRKGRKLDIASRPPNKCYEDLHLDSTLFPILWAMSMPDITSLSSLCGR
jgi:hypothetical protein